MGENNVLNISLKGDDKGNFIGVCNVHCLSAVVYKKFFKRTTTSISKLPPPKKINCYIQTLKNTPSNGVEKIYINTIIKETMPK